MLEKILSSKGIKDHYKMNLNLFRFNKILWYAFNEYDKFIFNLNNYNIYNIIW